MSSGGENESEILLGNKQLLAIFFVIAFLLFVAFTGGYMVGRGSPDKKPLIAAAPATENQPKDSGLETHPVGPATAKTAPEEVASEPKTASRRAAKPNTEVENPDQQDQPPLGTPKRKGKGKATAGKQPEAAPASNTPEEYLPQTGQMFLQVVALQRDDAYGVTEVLAKKGFRAHAVPKPGSGGKVYRVLVGPIRDTSELSATRDALRKNAGFQDIILQHY
jgi:cell division septation protein DedD